MYTQTEGSLVPCPVGGPGCRESVDLDLVARCCPAREDAPANIGQQALQHFQLEAVKLAAEAQLVQRQLAKACDDLQDAKGVLSEEDRVTATACRGVRKALSLATLVVCPACGGSAPLCAADLPQHCMAMHCTSKGCRLSGAAGYCFLCRKEFPAPTRGALQTQDSLHSHVSQCERHPYRCVTWLGRGEVTPLPCVPTLQALASKASLRSACSPPTHRLGGGGQRSRLREPQYFLDVQDWDSLVAIMIMHAVKAVEEVLHDLKDSQLDQLRSTPPGAMAPRRAIARPCSLLNIESLTSVRLSCGQHGLRKATVLLTSRVRLRPRHMLASISPSRAPRSAWARQVGLVGRLGVRLSWKTFRGSSPGTTRSRRVGRMEW